MVNGNRLIIVAIIYGHRCEDGDFSCSTSPDNNIMYNYLFCMRVQIQARIAGNVPTVRGGG